MGFPGLERRVLTRVFVDSTPITRMASFVGLGVFGLNVHRSPSRAHLPLLGGVNSNVSTARRKKNVSSVRLVPVEAGGVLLLEYALSSFFVRVSPPPRCLGRLRLF